MSFAAHIAGGFAGMSIGYTVFSCFDQALLKDPRFWTAIAAYLAFVLFAVFSVSRIDTGIYWVLNVC